MSGPLTEAGRRLLAELDGVGRAPFSGVSFPGAEDDIAAIEAEAAALDVERLWRVLEGVGVIENGTWVSFRREDADRIAREYAALAEPEGSAT